VKARAHEYITGEFLRCGRCAGLLPDETLTFCPHCGNLFSKVPPTTAYCDLQVRRFEAERRRQYLRFTAGFLGAFVVGFFLYTLVYQFYREQVLSHLNFSRKIVVYIENHEKIEGFSKNVMRQAVFTGVQAFEDHFGLSIDHWEIREGARPPMIADLLEEGAVSGGWEHLSFWKSFFDTRVTNAWKKNPYGELPIYFSNFPIIVDGEQGKKIETKHLSRSGLVSGLGHPGLVLLSTYRAKKEWNFEKDADAVRFLGEYVFAHELGHALVGLLDYVVPTAATLRSPASLATATSLASQCLMHTDQGGGNWAWSQLKIRSLGVPSPCSLYSESLNAHRLRREAIESAKAGKIAEALVKMESALAKVQGKLSPWIEHQWKREKSLLESL
jgi:hypothetical protein